MKRPGLWLGLILVVGLFGWLLIGRRQTQAPSPEPAPPEAPATTAITSGIVATRIPMRGAVPPDEPVPLIGEVMLRDYGDPAMPPVKDLQCLAALIGNMTLLEKSIQDRPMSGNEDWAAALRGDYPGHQRFLPDRHRALNDDGLLVDRWGTPLFFHPVGPKAYEIRSAGPDRKMWTADDLHRNPDGSFRDAADLNRPGLFDPSAPPAR